MLKKLKLTGSMYAGQEATVRTGHGITDWFQIGKGVRQGCILSPCLFNLYAEYIMRNARLEETQAGINIAGRNINHFMGNRWGNSGNSVKLYFIGLKITADGDCRHEIKRRLLLGRKVMTNLDSIFKSRYITLPIKVHLVKAMIFPVIMYGYESWTVKKAESQRSDAFELWCWRRLESP